MEQNEHRVLAIVPARGGSKGIPRKNLTPVAGLPLIAHTLRAALAARCVDRVVVTTDSPEIAAAAREHGGEVPFLRPAELARDDTPGAAPVLHAVEWLVERESYQPSHIVLLQPTSPLRAAEDIDAAVLLAQDQGAESVISVCAARQHPYWMKRLDKRGVMAPFVDAPGRFLRRQDLPPAYALNGAVYVVRRDVLQRERGLHGAETLAYVMPPERSLDVDTPWDLRLVRLLMEAQPEGGRG